MALLIPLWWVELILDMPLREQTPFRGLNVKRHHGINAPAIIIRDSLKLIGEMKA